MIIECTSISISDEKILISGINIERILMSDADLYEEIFDDEEVTFCFDRRNNGGSHMKYLYKLVSNNKACKAEKSMGARLEKLPSQLLSISESFLVKE